MSTLNVRAPGSDVRIMSSNILFDKSLIDRIPLLDAYYRDCAADVIGMQEVNKVGLGLLDAVQDVYAAVATSFSAEKHCFTPILYRRDRFDVIESGCVLHEMRATDTKSFSWVVLSDRTTGKKLAVINSHGSLILPAHKLQATDPVEGEQWRVDNVRCMLEKKDALRAAYGNIAVFVTGDFNAQPDSNSINAMKKGMPDSADVATVSATNSINSFHRAPGQPCPLTKPIDFVFVTDDAIEVLTHTVPSDEAALAISDHCPVWVDAKLK